MKKLLVVVSSLFIMACSNTATSDESVSLAKSGGEGIFVEKCGMCHGPAGMGTGILERRLGSEQALLENRTDLQGAFITTVIRSGFNTMFPLSRAEVSDDQLAEIIQYLED